MRWQKKFAGAVAQSFLNLRSGKAGCTDSGLPIPMVIGGYACIWILLKIAGINNLFQMIKRKNSLLPLMPRLCVFGMFCGIWKVFSTTPLHSVQVPAY